ncbi:hypothetical protein DRN58_01225 [Thermococci archaeon]|nr:MAG: hypothetical protein DRN58_01225 [Thermococci archaeon]
MWIETKEPYKDCRVYGVYWNKDGRSRVAVIFPNGKKKTVSYPKFLMEVKLGRFLEKNETVDHIDGNPRNNDYSNLRILKRDDHAKVEVKRLKRMQFKCPMCGKTFWLSGKKLHDAIWNRKRGKVGPFCSKSCAGRYSNFVQHGKMKKLKIKEIKPKYYTWKELEKLGEL